MLLVNALEGCHKASCLTTTSYQLVSVSMSNTPMPDVLRGIHKVVALAGSERALAVQLGVSQPAVNKWVKRGCVPPGRCVEIEAQYGVSRRELLEPRFMDLLDKPLDEGEG